MRRLTRSKLIMWAFVLAAVYMIAAIIVPSVRLIVVLNGIFLGIVVAVTIVYAPLIWSTLGRKEFDRVGQLSVGIGLLWASIASQRLWSSVFNYYQAPIEWINHPITGAITFMAIVGGCLFVTAPGYPPKTSIEPVELWGANRRLLLILGSLGGMLAFVLSVWPGIRF